jgi:hypothetical protein
VRQLILALLLPLGLYGLHWLLQVIRYRRSAYFSVTKKSFLGLDVGSYGEYLVYKRLVGFEKRGGRLLFNLYIPKLDGGTTEIDVVLIHPRGLFVFESKNFSGWIFGNEAHEYWTQTLPSVRGSTAHKERFFNPIRQNALHVMSLKRLCGDQVPVWSVIVFSDSCELKDVTVSEGKPYKVVQLRELSAAVSSIAERSSGVALSAAEIERLYIMLYPFSQVDEEARERHALAVHRAEK